MSRQNVHDTPTLDSTAAPTVTGIALLHDPALNKGTAFTDEERDRLHLRGLLPPRVLDQEQQLQKVLETFRAKPSDIEKYVYLISLQDRNERLFYQLVTAHMAEMMPIIYTPTVGQACQRYAHLWRRPRGLFLSARERGRIAETLGNWPSRDVRMIVVTDGERILGLGDLGANGMGIPVGKLSLYTACAGVAPGWCLPVTLDVGTENDALLRDPLYIGLPQRRLRGAAYDALIEEFMDGVAAVFPRAVVQFEDFASTNAFRILRTYRDRACCFNDDIQGTAAVTLAGLWSAIRMAGLEALGAGNLLFLGAGEAGTGIADLVVRAMMHDGIAEADARRRCWFVDSTGLVVSSRPDLAEHKRPYAQHHPPLGDLQSAIEALRPVALIGVSGQPQTFTRPVIEAMSAINERPIIFALSNPTSKAECTAEQAYGWSGGRAIFASGSPFPPFQFEDRTFVPGQANNAYIFPGVGLGVIASGARRVTDEMFMTAARTLADAVGTEDLRRGSIFPPLERIREISAAIATAVAQVAYDRGLASEPMPRDPRRAIEAMMFDPAYRDQA
jgi:malate dehydrogenase (oxaloacetate-decarboxylating)(NADP+)